MKKSARKLKDDAIVVDHDFKMAQLWTWDIASGEEKQLTKDESTVSDPRWSPDGSHITFTSNPTPLQDDSSLQTRGFSMSQRAEAQTGRYHRFHAHGAMVARWQMDRLFEQRRRVDLPGESLCGGR